MIYIVKSFSIVSEEEVNVCLFAFSMIHTVKGFSVVNKAEIEKSREFWKNIYDSTDVGNFIFGSSAFSKCLFWCWNWFQIGKGVCQGCILSPCLFNLYAEYLMQNAGLEEAQVGILGSKMTSDGDCSHEIKRCLLQKTDAFEPNNTNSVWYYTHEFCKQWKNSGQFLDTKSVPNNTSIYNVYIIYKQNIQF